MLHIQANMHCLFGSYRYIQLAIWVSCSLHRYIPLGDLSPLRRVPVHSASRLSPLLRVPVHSTSRLSPLQPVPVHSTSSLSPLRRVPVYSASRLSPLWRVPVHSASRLSPVQPVPVHSASRLSPLRPTRRDTCLSDCRVLPVAVTSAHSIELLFPLTLVYCRQYLSAVLVNDVKVIVSFKIVGVTFGLLRRFWATRNI
jgi:hypothetical protein